MEHPGKPTIHHVTLKRRQEVARGTMSFYFDRPSTFTFKAGQFIDLTLPHLSTTEPQGHSRAFTLASAPSEQQLMVTTRLRDTAYKRMLRDMPLGSTFDMEGPFGQFTMQYNDSRTVVFLAGGIGITPFRRCWSKQPGTNFRNLSFSYIRIAVRKMRPSFRNCNPSNKTITLLNVSEQSRT